MDIENQIRRIAQGDRHAFADLYRARMADLIRYAAALLAGDQAEAADAVDEAFLDVWRHAGRFTGEGSAEGWLRRIVRNKTIDAIRKRKSGTFSGEEAEERIASLPDTSNTPEENAQATSAQNELRAALDRLSPEHREVVWLCYFEDKSMQEIAKIVGCPENTVKTRLYHARLKLRDLVTS
jgi:RNA polymerase sigma-70 factor, ECF subfamily